MIARWLCDHVEKRRRCDGKKKGVVPGRAGYGTRSVDSEDMFSLEKSVRRIIPCMVYKRK
jgi:hypothetical protein